MGFTGMMNPYRTRCTLCDREIVPFVGNTFCDDCDADDVARVTAWYVAVLDRCGPSHFLDDEHECEPMGKFMAFDYADDVYDPPSGELRIGREVVEH